MSKILGTGEYGTVYDFDKDKAVKIQKIPHDDCIPPSILIENDILINSNHRNIVKCFSVKQTPDKIMTVMEKCDHTIAQWKHSELNKFYTNKHIITDIFKDEIQVLTSQMIGYIHGIFSGLAYLHTHHIVHGDIKPQNILLLGKDVKIVDFGLSQHIFNDQFRHSIIQSSWYRAPEVIIGYPFYDERVDIWSTGILLIDLIFSSIISKRENHFDILFDYINILGVPKSETWTKLVNESLTDVDIEDVKQIKHLLNMGNKRIISDRGALTSWLKNHLSHNYKVALELYGEDLPALLEIIEGCLVIDPMQRLHATTILDHALFKKHNLYTMAPIEGSITPYGAEDKACPSPDEKSPHYKIYETISTSINGIFEHCKWHKNSLEIATSILNRLFAAEKSREMIVKIDTNIQLWTIAISLLAMRINHGEVSIGNKILPSGILNGFFEAAQISKDHNPTVKYLESIIYHALDYRLISEDVRKSLFPFINYF